MIIEKSNARNSWRATQGNYVGYGHSPVKALNDWFLDYYWRNGMVKPKSLYEKLLGWSIFSNE